jgi:hypothetical protein
LLETREKIIRLIDFGFRPITGNFPEGKAMPFSEVDKLTVGAVRLLHEGSRVRTFAIITANL